MGIGHTNHNWGLDTSEVDAFNNGNKTSIWYSFGCWASAYDYSNCIAEHFVRDTDGGGVAFIGNSRNGWFQRGYDDYASLRYDRYFFRSLFDQNHYKLGDLFSDHKMDAYNSMNQDDYNKYIFTGLTLLGDPELPLWINNPSSFIVSHPTEILVGYSSFTVHVENSTGSNIENAYVCLWKEDEVYLTNYTDNSGNVAFNPSSSTIGNMMVTVTKQDYIPFEGNVIVTYNQPPGAPIINGPNSGKPGNIYSYNFVTEDPNEDNVYYEINWGEGSVEPWNGPHDSNIVISRDHSWDEKGEFTIMARAKDVHGEIGEWSTFEVTMPYSFWWLDGLMDRFPFLQRLLEVLIS
jgi:hypothetical protein